MKIYTKTGDKGDTSLFGGKRLPKDDLRIEAYGTVDELNSLLGVCRSLKPPADLEAILDRLQQDLFVLGADLATPIDAKQQIRRINADDTIRLESTIDEVEGKLEPLRSFILPGGSQVGAMLHFGRAVCRRAERAVVRCAHQQPLGDQVVVFLNRLADLLFVLARYANQLAGVGEQKWEARS